MQDAFFHGFADELTKLGGPIDWFKKKFGGAPSPAPVPPPRSGDSIGSAGKAIKRQKNQGFGGVGSGSSQRNTLKREGVFGM